ncbi:hypothetical protein C0J52_24121 [Blattella germanica]|nr:hypothetical protein C0J52_24121 [Blattella germanica]
MYVPRPVNSMQWIEHEDLKVLTVISLKVNILNYNTLLKVEFYFLKITIKLIILCHMFMEESVI